MPTRLPCSASPPANGRSPTLRNNQREPMSTINHYPHLVQGQDGVMRIGASRYKVTHLAAEHYHYGWSAEELLRQHPDLRPEEVYAALTYSTTTTIRWWRKSNRPVMRWPIRL